VLSLFFNLILLLDYPSWDGGGRGDIPWKEKGWVIGEDAGVSNSNLHFSHSQESFGRGERGGGEGRGKKGTISWHGPSFLLFTSYGLSTLTSYPEEEGRI